MSNISMLDPMLRGTSGPCHNRRRFERQVLLGQLVWDIELESLPAILPFQVTNPSGKLMTAISVGLACNGNVGVSALPVAAAGIPGTWDLTPAFYGPNGEIVLMSKVVDSSQLNTSSNPCNIPNGWEVESMAPVFVGQANITPSVFSNPLNTEIQTAEAIIDIWLCVAWEDVTGSYDPKEIENIFADCMAIGASQKKLHFAGGGT